MTTLDHASIWDLPPRRIAVFRALQLGDMLCAVPALRALRAHAPAARITLIGLPWATALAERFPTYLDEVLPFPGAPGFPEQPPRPERLDAFLQAARARQFDLALQLHGSGERSNPIVRQLGAARCAGYAPAGSPPEPGFVPWSDRGSEPRRWLQLLRQLGVAPQGESLEFPLTDADRAAARATQRRHGLVPGHYVCIHPGARLRSRRWPLGRFARVARALAAEGWGIAVTGGNEETMLTEPLADSSGGVSLAGRTGLGELAALIADARLVVCNDTGISHVAAALRTPSVVVACGSDVRRWAPLDRRRHRVLARQVACRPCMHFECPIGHPCAVAITPERVLAECQRQLRTPLRHAA